MHSQLILYFVILIGCDGANILAILPTPSPSHHFPFIPLWKELAKRGHNLTLVTTEPIKDVTLKNIHQIDISYGYKIIKDFDVINLALNDSVSFREKGSAAVLSTRAVNRAFFSSSEGMNLIHNKANKFDLLIAEALLPPMLVFSWWFQIPYIGISSLDCSPQFHEAVGNVNHPILNPDSNLPIDDYDGMSFLERLTSVLYNLVLKYMIATKMNPGDREMLKEHFGPNVPSIEVIYKNISMLFIATNPIFHNVRPLMPNTITIGNGMQIVTGTTPLENDVAEFLDTATEGAIYFSLGGNIQAKHLTQTTINNLIEAFKELPYKILWKIDVTFEDLPKNIKTYKWFKSQIDILQHSNIKLFITQGGLQSMQEAVYSNKPMIGIPFFGDQIRNVNRMAHLGYGIKLNKNEISKNSIQGAIKEIIDNPKYTKKAEEFGDILRDVDWSNLDKAVWWTEYVIRHQGAKHFKNPLLDMPFWKIHLLDVYGTIILFIIVSYKLLKLTLKLIKT